MIYSPAELAERLKAEGESVLNFFGQLTPSDWKRPVYSEKSIWTIREVLAHFIASERGFQILVDNVASGKEGVEEHFPVDVYNETTVAELKGLEPEVLLGQYAMTRERTVALVRSLSPAQLALQGRHPALGQSPLGDMVRVIYHHNSLHLRDVRAVLRATRGAQTLAGLA